jgi:hypothetical protein
LGGLFGNVREMDFNINLCIGLTNNLAASGNSHLGILISLISLYERSRKAL